MLPNLQRRRSKGFVTRLAKKRPRGRLDAFPLLLKGKRYTSPMSQKNVHKRNLKCYQLFIKFKNMQFQYNECSI